MCTERIKYAIPGNRRIIAAMSKAGQKMRKEIRPAYGGSYSLSLLLGLLHSLHLYDSSVLTRKVGFSTLGMLLQNSTDEDAGALKPDGIAKLALTYIINITMTENKKKVIAANDITITVQF